MIVELSEQAITDIAHWNKTDPKKAAKIFALLKSIMETPFSGMGKPEPLKYDLAGYWSRRIDHEHRLVYTTTEKVVFVASCRYHYR